MILHINQAMRRAANRSTKRITAKKLSASREAVPAFKISLTLLVLWLACEVHFHVKSQDCPLYDTFETASSHFPSTNIVVICLLFVICLLSLGGNFNRVRHRHKRGLRGGG